VTFQSHALAEFWTCYNALPLEVRKQADKQFDLFERNPSHGSLHFKAARQYWPVRVSRGYRALARRRDDHLFWFWIGSHDDYEELIQRG
jgi:hypothetical protein